MKHLRLFTNENELLEAQKNFLPLPNISLEEEYNQVHLYNPSENEVVLYFVTEPSMGTKATLKLFSATNFSFHDFSVFYDGNDVTNQIVCDSVGDNVAKITVDATKRNIHKVIFKGPDVFMHGGFMYYSHAVAIDYPKNTGTNYLGVIGSCPNLTSIRLMNELPSSIKIDKFPESSTNEGVLYYNSKYDYSQIINNLNSGWTAVAI